MNSFEILQKLGQFGPMGRLFLLLLFFRIINSLLVVTFFDPDETWQSLEVAHWKTWGIGYLTWEWKAKIRSFVHPFLFYLVYKLLLGLSLLDSISIIWGPRLLQAFIAALNDYFLFKWAYKLYSLRIAKIVLLVSLLNWFNFYFMVRTCNI